jgi:hypothetical protein
MPREIVEQGKWPAQGPSNQVSKEVVMKARSEIPTTARSNLRFS